MHGCIGKDDPALARRIQIGINVHDGIRPFGRLVASAAFAGTVIGVLQAVYCKSIQIMRCCIDRTVSGQGSNLRILAVLS